MGIIEKTTKATEHKIIDNFIAIWKKVKPSKTYWTIAIPTGLFILSQVKSWKWAEVVASYAQKQIEGSVCPFCWEVLSALATELTDTARWELVGVGFALLIIITYAFGKESSSKQYKEVLEKVIDNTTQNNYFVTELNRKNKEVNVLKEQLTKVSEDERLKLSYEIEELVAEKEQWEFKAKTLQERLSESDIEVVQKVNTILNTKGIDEALIYLESIDFDKHEKQTEEYAKALLIQADLYDLNNEHEKAKDAYLKSIKFHRTFSNSLDFVNYLSRQNEDFEFINELEIMLLELSFSVDEKRVFLDFLAKQYVKQNNFFKAKEIYNEILNEYRLLSQNNLSEYSSDIAVTLNNLGNLYSNSDEFDKAEKVYKEGLELTRVLAKNNPSEYNSAVAMTLNNLATLYSYKNEFDKAEEIYIEALKLKQSINQNNLGEYNSDISMTLNNLANIYKAKNKIEKAEELYNKSLVIRRNLAKNNPSAYNADVATTLNNLANLYSDINEFKKAEKTYFEALKLRVSLAKNNPGAYNSDVAMTLYNLANLYSDINKLEKAEKMYHEALELYKSLAKYNQSVYDFDISMILNNLANLYSDIGEVEKAEIAYTEALELRRALAQKNPDVYNSDVALTLNSLANLYSNINKVEKAEKAYTEALELRRALAQKNPSTYNPDVAMILNNLAVLYGAVNQLEKAEEAYNKALELRRELSQNNPMAYGVNLAKMIIMGVYLLGFSKENLNEAEKILKGFDGIMVDQLLDSIEQIRNGE